MMAYSEDHIALAAEYALGTLDADERAQAESLMSIDKDFTAMVQAWEFRLGVLNQMVGSVEPSPEVWDRIKAATGLSVQEAPLVLSEPPPPAPVVPEIVTPEAVATPEAIATPAAIAAPEVIATPSAIVADNSNVIRLSARARRWRNVAAAITAIAAALVAVIGVGVWQPDLLPDAVRPKPLTKIVEVKAPRVPAPPSAQYVALLQKDGGAPAFILTVDAATRKFTIRRVGPPAELGKSYELWLISDKLQRPRSLGVVGSGDFTSRQVLASYDPDTVKDATYAVTIEQGGGSPDGKPTSPPVYSGKLIESVPSR
jgi:anti-sigma-K factor RskA